jgi:hypothetical protein
MTTKTWGARTLAATAALGLVLAMGTVSAGAGSVSGAITVNPTAVAPGEDFTVSGGANCDSFLTITIAGLGLSQTADGTAPWQSLFTAPAAAAPGTYAVVVTPSRCAFNDSTIVITAPATTTTTAPATTTTTAVAVANATAAAPAFTG